MLDSFGTLVFDINLNRAIKLCLVSSIFGRLPHPLKSSSAPQVASEE